MDHGADWQRGEDSQEADLHKQRVAVYIDGFNLFYGLKAKRWRRYYWLNLRTFAENLLRPHHRFQVVRYFTARVFPDADDPGKQARQTTYLEALATLPDLSVHYGKFLPKTLKCFNCGSVRHTYEEKMTDVNISVTLLNDAQENLFDTAMIVSADSDLVGPVQSVLERYPSKRIIIAFPPKRTSFDLRNVASASFIIGQDKLRRSQLPETVTRSDGFPLIRPTSWR